jgi:hypothetical protein
MFGEPWPDEDEAITRMAAGDYNKDAEIFPYPGSGGKVERPSGLGAWPDPDVLSGIKFKERRKR